MNRFAQIVVPFILALFIVSPQVGCGSPSERLVGTWKLDPQAAQKAMDEFAKQRQGTAAALGAAIVKEALQTLQATVTFERDGDYFAAATVAGVTRKTRGKWQFVRWDGEQMTIMHDFGENTAKRQRTIVFRDRDHIEMALFEQTAVPIEQKVVMVRSASEP